MATDVSFYAAVADEPEAGAHSPNTAFAMMFR